MSIKIIERYIATTVLSAIGLVTLMLAGLQIFILFVNQLGDMGKLDFGIVETTIFVLLQMPYQVYLFFPMASLLGCLIGLGVLANHSELVVMRAAGVSIGQVTKAVLKASMVVIFFVTVLGETIVPFMSHFANDYNTAALSGGQSIRTPQGMWLRYNNDFIRIGTVLPENVLQDVYQFHFDDSHQLKITRNLGEARYTNEGWVAYNINQTELYPDHTQAKFIASMPWNVPLKPKILSISGNQPDEMTLHELNRYLREQKQNHLNVSTYKLAFLQRLVQPFTTMVMMILAIPFIFGPLRSSSMGSKLLVGATVGFGFHIVNRFLGPISTVYQWPPELAAFAPTLIFAVLGIFLMRRVQ